MRIQIEQKNNYLTSDINKAHLASLYMESGDGAVLDMIQYAERRFAFTLLVSGGYLNGGAAIMGELPTAIGESATVRTRIPSIQEGTVEGSEVRYKIQGRQRRAVSVVGTAAYGTATPASATTGGFFSLVLATREITPNSVVEFPMKKIGRVHGEPRPNPSGQGFIYTFQTWANETFTWATWMGASTQGKTVWSSFNLVGESSRKGYMSWLMPDTYIQHTSTMRRGINLTGHALVSAGARKYSINTPNGGSVEGFSWTSETAMREQLNEDMDNMAWNGKSTMRDSYGNLLSAPSMVDEKGDPIYAGDGVKEQIRGVNDVIASGTDGLPTEDDFDELFTNARDRREPGDMSDIVYVTGPRGVDHLNNIYLSRNKRLFNIQTNPVMNGEKGGIPVLKTKQIEWNGETIYVVMNPSWGDKNRYGSLRMANGKLANEYEGCLLNFGTVNGKQNIAIEAVNNEFVNREYVIGQQNGMTGMKGVGKPQNSVDAMNMDILTERLVIVRDPKCCGLMEISSSYVY